MLWQVKRETNPWGLTRRAIPGGPKLAVKLVVHLQWAKTGGPVGSQVWWSIQSNKGERFSGPIEELFRGTSLVSKRWSKPGGQLAARGVNNKICTT